VTSKSSHLFTLTAVKRLSAHQWAVYSHVGHVLTARGGYRVRDGRYMSDGTKTGLSSKQQWVLREFGKAVKAGRILSNKQLEYGLDLLNRMVKAGAIAFDGREAPTGPSQVKLHALHGLSQLVIQDELDDEPIDAALESGSLETQLHRKKRRKRSSSHSLDPAVEDLARRAYGPAVEEFGIEYVVMVLTDHIRMGRYADDAG
jgi:hypothetical protein